MYNGDGFAVSAAAGIAPRISSQGLWPSVLFLRSPGVPFALWVQGRHDDAFGTDLNPGQTFEGGISGAPQTEAHGSYAFCVLACLCILGPPQEMIPKCGAPRVRWIHMTNLNSIQILGYLQPHIMAFCKAIRTRRRAVWSNEQAC